MHALAKSSAINGGAGLVIDTSAAPRETTDTGTVWQNYRGNPYQGSIGVSLKWDRVKKRLNLRLETERLVGRFVSEKDLVHYKRIFSDRETMMHYCEGAPDGQDSYELSQWQEERINLVSKRLTNSWIKRPSERNPFTAIAFYLKTATAAVKKTVFVGHVILGGGDLPGISELAYVISVEHWGKGFGTEAVAAVVCGLAPKLINSGYLIEGEPFKGICMTASRENIPSQKVALSAGLVPKGTVSRFGGVRMEYSASREEILSVANLRKEENWVEKFIQRVRAYPEPGYVTPTNRTSGAHSVKTDSPGSKDLCVTPMRLKEKAKAFPRSSFGDDESVSGDSPFKGAPHPLFSPINYTAGEHDPSGAPIRGQSLLSFVGADDTIEIRRAPTFTQRMIALCADLRRIYRRGTQRAPVHPESRRGVLAGLTIRPRLMVDVEI